MRLINTIFLFASLIVIAGCQNREVERMVLLDEEIKEVNVSKSNGIGNINQDILFSFSNEHEIKIFEYAIKTAVKQETDQTTLTPDFDVMVEYEEGFPTHAIHLWLGNKGEKSIMTYMVGEGETYVTSSKATEQLRELLITQQ